MIILSIYFFETFKIPFSNIHLATWALTILADVYAEKINAFGFLGLHEQCVTLGSNTSMSPDLSGNAFWNPGNTK